MYATASDMVTRFGAEELVQLTNRGSTPITADMLQTGAEGGDLSGYTQAEQNEIAAALVIINEALADATSLVDPYLTPRYSLPMSTTPRVLETFVSDIARHSLHGNTVPDSVRDRYKDAISFLRDVASGKASLGLDENNASTATIGGAQHESPDRVFTVDNLKSYTG